MSLDVFRGATIAAMMLVNNPGDWAEVYAPLLHAPWHGWTFTDLIFPFFLWIVGVAVPFSMARRVQQGHSYNDLFWHVARRALILFLLGLFLNSFSYFIDGSIYTGWAAWLHNLLTNVRIPGVLQRIAICYFFAGWIFLRCGPRGQFFCVLVLLVAYWLAMILIPVPGYGPGVLDKEGNLAQYLDNLVLNDPRIGTHVWKESKTWDPEGIISTVPAIVTCLFGVLAGQWLRSKYSHGQKTFGLLVAGMVLAFAGLVMDHWFPINKNLWTSSYTVFMAGMAMIFFSVCYWLVEVRAWRKWTKPLAIHGMNALAVFVLAGVLGRLSVDLKVMNDLGDEVALKSFLYGKFFAPFASPDTAPAFGFLASPKNASLAWALSCVLLLYLVAWIMYWRKWFVKL